MGDVVHRTSVKALNGMFTIPLPETLVALLPKLPGHSLTILYSFCFFTFVHLVLAPAVCARLFPQSYGKSGRKGRNNWAIHVVSQVHALIVVPLCLRCLGIPALDQDRVFGWDERVGVVHGIACGYFLWDFLDAVYNFVDFGFVVHGLLCLGVYSLSFKPFLAYYGVRCLLWETSTIFLNIHWFLDKTGRTGGKLQLYNGVLLMLAFFGVRLVYGGKTSYDFWKTIYAESHRISTVDKVAYGVGNIVLQGLNWLWFTKMLSALRKRFQPGPAQNGHAKNGNVNGYKPNGNGNGEYLHGNGNGNGYRKAD